MTECDHSLTGFDPVVQKHSCLVCGQWNVFPVLPLMPVKFTNILNTDEANLGKVVWEGELVHDAVFKSWENSK